MPLASLPFLSPRCVPPALAGSAAFVTSAVHICCLFPPPLLHRVSLLLAPAFLPVRNGAVLPRPRLPFPRCRLLSSDQGEPRCSPRPAQAEAVQLLSNCELLELLSLPSPTRRLRACSATTQGSGDRLGHSPLSCQTINRDANP